MATKIEWTDVTVNPFPGCKKVSPGCLHCYAERQAKWLKRMGRAAYQDVVDARGWTGKTSCQLEQMKVPGRGKLVFVNSMGDLFYGGISDEERDVVFGAMLNQHWHTFQVLTKRPELALGYYQGCIENAADFDGLPSPIVRAPNIWFGWTAEDQPRLDERTPFGMQIPAAIPFVSVEPMLGPVDFRGRTHVDESGTWDVDWLRGHAELRDSNSMDAVVDWPDCPKIDWVIVGCESGPNRRPCDTQWVADVFQQCEAAGTRRFIKQISIDGKVVKDPERIALELSGYVGRPLCVEDIRQFPARTA